MFECTIVPVAVGIADPDVLRAQITQKCTSLFSGSTSAYFVHLAKHFTSEGDWILELNPLTGKFYLYFEIEISTLDHTTCIMIEISIFKYTL